MYDSTCFPRLRRRFFLYPMTERNISSPETRSYLLTFETERAVVQMLRAGEHIPKAEQPRFDALVHEYEKQVTEALQEAMKDVPVRAVAEDEFYTPLEEQMAQVAQEVQEQKTGEIVVCIDKYTDRPRSVPGVWYISAGRARLPDGTKEIRERPGDLYTLEEQIAQLPPNSRIVLIDDGVSTVDATTDYLGIFELQGHTITRMVAGVLPKAEQGEWATERYLQERQIPCKCVVDIANPLDWICARDFLLGPAGKTVLRDDGGFPLAAPYFFPFTRGESASIPQDRLIAFSQRIIKQNIQFYQGLGSMLGRDLTMRDIWRGGYGLPTSELGIMPEVTMDMRVVDYLEMAYVATQKYTPPLEDCATASYLTDADRHQEVVAALALDESKMVHIMGISGGGRDTILEAVIQKLGQQSISAARAPRTSTRPLRSGENGTTLEHVSEEEFVQRIQKDLLAYDIYEANGATYGMSSEALVRASSDAQVVLTEGTEGALALKQLFPGSTLVVVLPPNEEAIHVRLSGRDGADNQETQRRCEESVRQYRLLLERIPQLHAANIDICVVLNEEGQIDACADQIISCIRDRKIV